MAFYSKFAQYYDSTFPFKQLTFDFLKSYASSDTRNVLDVGCGTGRYTAAFSDAGFTSSGIDLDSAMIHYAAEHFPQSIFYTMNMLDIVSLDQQFDFIFCIGNTLAHLNEQELNNFLQTVHTCLSENGLWIFQVRNWEYVLQHNVYDFPLIEANAGHLQFVRSYTNISSQSLQFNTRLTDQQNIIFEDSVTMTPLTSQHYIDLHHKQHFQLLDHFGDFKRTPFDPTIDSANIFIFKKQQF